jgi:hypothetical protein
LQHLARSQILDKRDDPQLRPIPIRSCAHGLPDISMAGVQCNGPDPFTHNVIVRQGHSAIFASRNLGRKLVLGERDKQAELTRG